MDELKKKVPFHCLITGPTNCGKTKFLVEQLRGPFRHTFEYIVLICPTYPHNKTYRGFAKGDPRFIVLCPDSESTDEIDELLSCCQTFFSRTNTLLILDDCAVSKDLKKRSNKFISKVETDGDGGWDEMDLVKEPLEPYHRFVKIFEGTGQGIRLSKKDFEAKYMYIFDFTPGDDYTDPVLYKLP